MTPEERYARGKSAAWLLEQEAFATALDSCRVHCQMQWANTALQDKDTREAFFHKFTAVNEIEPMLKNFVEDGNRADEELNGDK